MIGEYAGELITDDEWDRRATNYTLAGVTNFFFGTCTSMTIDASAMGNHTRFINHNCRDQLNCKVEYAMINDYPKNFIVSMVDIKAGEQIFINYGANYFTDLKCLCGSKSFCYSKKKQ